MSLMSLLHIFQVQLLILITNWYSLLLERCSSWQIWSLKATIPSRDRQLSLSFAESLIYSKVRAYLSRCFECLYKDFEPRRMLSQLEQS